MNLLLIGSWTWFWETINGLFLTLCNWIYVLISLLYKIFEAIAKINLFSEDAFNGFTQRIYVIIGIAMLFIFAYNLILMIINPNDKKTTGQMTKIVKETIISLVLVILLPTIFNYMYVFQNHVIESNIIGKIMLGGIETGTCDSSISKIYYPCTCDFGNMSPLSSYTNETRWLISDATTNVIETLSAMCRSYKDPKILSDSQRGAFMIAPTLIQAFYRPTAFTMEECENGLRNDFDTAPFKDNEDMKKVCVNYFYDIRASEYTGNISPFVMDTYLRSIVSGDTGIIELNGLMAIVAGVIALLMFLSYTIDIGARVGKLGLLQIISPIAVMMRIIPKQKEKFYDKWFNHLMDTYIDVFMRLFIIYFVLYVVTLVPEVVDTIWSSFASGSDNLFIKSLVLVFLILGLLKFAQDAPGLFKEFFGSSGKFSLKKDFKTAKGVLGAAGTMGAIGSKNVMDTVNNFKKNGFKEGMKSTLKNTPRALGQGVMGAYRGYKAGRDSKSFSEMRDGVFGTAAKELSKATTKDKIKGFLGTEKDAIQGFYKANYRPFNSSLELKKADKLEEVSKKQKAFEALLDKSDQVDAVNRFYEARLKTAAESGASPETLETLMKSHKDALNEARSKVYAERKGDAVLKSALDDYRSAITSNLGLVNEALTLSGKDAIVSANDILSDAILSNKDTYSKSKSAGKASGDRATVIRQQAIAEKTKADGGSK